MREDMFKVIVERPRLVNSTGYSRDGRKFRNDESAPARLDWVEGKVVHPRTGILLRNRHFISWDRRKRHMREMKQAQENVDRRAIDENPRQCGHVCGIEAAAWRAGVEEIRAGRVI